MRRHLLFLFLLTSSTIMMYGQTFLLTGRVTDENHSPVELASVSCPEQTRATMTDLKGEFTLALQSRDSVVVKFSMVGYASRKRTFHNPRGRVSIEVTLPTMEALGEVVVTEKRRQTTGTGQLDIKDIQGAPSSTGNAVEELIQQQAGVSTHNELSSQYNVRGGSFDENSVYINGTEIYRPLLIRSGQQEGLSVINADMVERVAFSTGGFEAKYGDKMASALDITYRRPRGRHLGDSSSIRGEGRFYASLLGAGAYVGLAGKKWTMSHGLRYKTNRVLLRSLETKGEYDPRFLDYQTYITCDPNPKWSIDMIGNISDNRYNFSPEDRETKFGTLENVKSFRVYFDGQEKDLFRTYFGSMSITYHPNLTTRVKMQVSAFRTKEQETFDIQGQYWLTQTETSENLGVGTYLQHARNYLEAGVGSLKMIVNRRVGSHDIEGGATFKTEHVKETAREYEMRDSSGYSVPHTGKDLKLIYSLDAREELNSRRFESYLQDTYRFSGGAGDDGHNATYYTLNYGARMSYWDYNKELLFSPRASLAIIPAFNDAFTFRIAAGVYYQAPFYKELRDTNTVDGITTVTLNKHIKSQRSIHFVAGMDYRFKMNSRPFMFTAEAYFKHYSNLIPYNIDNMKIVYYGENRDKGYAAGVDLKLYGEFVPGTDSWLSLSLMKTEEKALGQWVPMPSDQRYALNLHFTDYFPGTQRWKMTLRLAYADGLPFGAPHKGIEDMYFRAPAYKRADIGMSYRAVRDGKTIRNLWLGIDCLNLLGINNVNSYYWITDVENHQYAVPNYLTGRQLNFTITAEL